MNLSVISIANVDFYSWALFFLIILASLAFGSLVKYSFSKIAAKSTSASNKRLLVVTLKALANPVMFLAFVIGFRLSLFILDLTPKLLAFLSTISGVLNSIALGYLIYSMVDVVDYWLQNWAKRTESKVDDLLAPLVGKAIRITVMVLVILNVVVEVSGKDMTTILASLGVGGLAIALAGQDTIRNFFGSIVIFADKPFELGDRVVVDGHDGPVETVGFRSTKIRTLDGHLVTVPNSEMVNKTVRNIGQRPYIKRVVNIGVTYDTAPDKLERALEIIKGILDNHEGMDADFPPRVYFSDFKDSSLNIIVIYWYHPPDYWKYMEFSEQFNMKVLSQFNEEGINFAFPTRTLHVHQDG